MHDRVEGKLKGVILGDILQVSGSAWEGSGIPV